MSGRTLAGLVVLASILATHAAALKAAEMVIVTEKDGKKKVIGELVSADGDKVVVKPEDEENVELKWSDIQKVSNGLTQVVAAQRWKALNADKVCPTCHGDRVIACPKCGGTGKDAVAKALCKNCNGTGQAKCTVKSCVNGMCDCPGQCLKLSEGNWEFGQEDLRWRKFTYPGGWASWSERHLGQIIAYEDGKPVNKGVCPQCNGTTKIKCLLCTGSGKIVCPVCLGSKEVAAACAVCQNGKVTCPTCKGTGVKP